MAASAIDKNLRAQRSVSHAGFIGTMINTDDEGHLTLISERTAGGSPSASTSNLNENEASSNQPSYTDNSLSFHPLKSYKTGQISGSSMSIMTEIGPVFTSDSSTDKGVRDIPYNKNRNLLLDSKPIRASKSTLDLPSLTEQEFLKTKPKEKGKQSLLFVNTDLLPSTLNNNVPQQEVDESSRRRHKSAASTPSPASSPKILREFGNRSHLTKLNNNNNEDAHGYEKPKKRRSFKIKTKLNNKDKDSNKGANISPANVKVSTQLILMQ